MTIFTGGGRRRDKKFMEEYPAPLGDVLSAEAKNAWLRSPFPSIGRHLEQQQAGGRDDRTGILAGMPRDLDPTEAEVEEPEVISKEAADEELKARGFELDVPSKGMRREEFDLLIGLKQEEANVQFTLNRAPRGFGPAALRFGTHLGVTMLDPVNIASAFLPVVGQARYARMLKQASSGLGRAGVRARVGAVEGAAGAAVVEPIVYGQARAEQADYGMADVLSNIAVGTVLGGGLHMGAGAVADAFRRGRSRAEAEPNGPLADKVATYSRENRDAILRAALGQELSGRAVNVDDFVNHIDATEAIAPSSLASARRQVTQEWHEVMRGQLRSDGEARLSSAEREAVEQEIRAVEQDLGRTQGRFSDKVKELQRDEGMTRREAERHVKKTDAEARNELEARRAVLEEQLRMDDVARGAREDLEKLERGEVPEQFKEQIDEAAQSKFDAGRDAPAKETVEKALGARSDVNPQETWSALRKAAELNQEPAALRGHKPELSRIIREEVELQSRQPETAEQAQTEADEVMADLQEMEARMDQRFIDDAELQARDAEIENAGQFGEGLRAMASCQMRRG